MANTSSQAQRVQIPAAGHYQVDPTTSSVAFRTRHMFGLAGVAGTMPVVAGDISLDPSAPEASVSVTVSAASFSTGHTKRDKDATSAKFLNVDEHPEITFQANTLSQASGQWKLDGMMEVRGVREPVSFAIDSVETTARGFRAHATTRIDRYAFGVTAAKGMAARHLDVELTVVAQPV